MRAWHRLVLKISPLEIIDVDVAQMVEYVLSMHEARGSMPLIYTFFFVFFFAL